MKKFIGYVVKVKKMWDDDFDFYFFEKLSLAKTSADVYNEHTTATIYELYADCYSGKMTLDPMDY